MFPRILTALSVVFFLSSLGPAQQSACKAGDIPVGVISPNGDIFRGLAVGDFFGRLQKKAVTRKTLSHYDGPRPELIFAGVKRKLSHAFANAQIQTIKTLLFNTP